MIGPIFAAVSANSGLAGVSSHLGSEFLDVNDAPPVLVWVPLTVDVQTGQGKSRTTDKTIRSIYTASMLCRVRVWAKGTIQSGETQSLADFRELWDLLRRFLVAVYDAGVGSVRPTRASYLTEGGQALVEFGKAVDVELEWDAPVTRDPLVLATITNFLTDGGLNLPVE